jgi:hypothetical protein
MAIALVDAKHDFADGADTTIDIANVTVSGTDAVMYVVIVWGSSTAAPTAAVVVWDSAGANQNFETVDSNNPFASVSNPARGMALYRLVNPTTGSNKIVSISNLNAAVGEVAMAVVFSGVDQSTPNGTIDIVESGGGGAVTTTQSNPMTCASGNWLVSFISLADATPNFAVTGTGQVIRDSIASSAGSNNALGFADDRDGSNDTFTWTHDSSASGGLFTFELKASGAAPFVPQVTGNPSRDILPLGEMPAQNALASGLLNSQPPFFTVVDGKRLN